MLIEKVSFCGSLDEIISAMKLHSLKYTSVVVQEIEDKKIYCSKDSNICFLKYAIENQIFQSDKFVGPYPEIFYGDMSVFAIEESKIKKMNINDLISLRIPLNQQGFSSMHFWHILKRKKKMFNDYLMKT